jgi:MFS family permease
VINAYMVMYGGFLLLGGRAGDVLGRRRVLIGGVALFTAASLASGLADAVGALAATAGSSLLAYAIMQTDTHPWGSARTVGLLAGATLLLGYFGLHEARIAREPLLPTSLLRNRSVTGANAVAALQSCAIFAVFYLATLYQQQVLHYSALRTGLAYVPFGLIVVGAAGAGPALVTRLGIRYATVVGSLVAAGGLALFTRITPQGGLLTNVVVPELVLGAGLGVLFIPTNVAALLGVPTSRGGVASALLNVSRQLGGTLGLAAISTAVAARTTARSQAGRPAAVALTDGYRLGFAIGVGLMCATALVALVLLREDGRGERVDLAELKQASVAEA